MTTVSLEIARDGYHWPVDELRRPKFTATLTQQSSSIQTAVATSSAKQPGSASLVGCWSCFLFGSRNLSLIGPSIAQLLLRADGTFVFEQLIGASGAADQYYSEQTGGSITSDADSSNSTKSSEVKAKVMQQGRWIDVTDSASWKQLRGTLMSQNQAVPHPKPTFAIRLLNGASSNATSLSSSSSTSAATSTTASNRCGGYDFTTGQFFFTDPEIEVLWSLEGEALEYQLNAAKSTTEPAYYSLVSRKLSEVVNALAADRVQSTFFLMSRPLEIWLRADDNITTSSR